MLKMLTLGVAVTSGLWAQSRGSASVEQINVLSAVGMRQVLVELAPTLERGAGRKINLTFDSGATIVWRIEGGEGADGLGGQGAAVDQEEDAAADAGLHQAVGQGDGRLIRLRDISFVVWRERLRSATIGAPRRQHRCTSSRT